MDMATTVRGRVARLLLRVLFVLAGAFLTTLATWLISSVSASADTLPGIGQPLLGAAVNSASATTGTVGDTVVSTPALLSRLVTDRLVTGPLVAASTGVGGHEVAAEPARIVAATSPAVVALPRSRGGSGPSSRHGLTHATTVVSSAPRPRIGTVMPSESLVASGIGARHETSSALSLKPGCPPCRSWTVPAGPGSAGNAGSSRSGDVLSRTVSCGSDLSCVASVGVLSGSGAHVPVASGRQPGVTPD